MEKPLGYVLTVFHDSGDPPDLKLTMPPVFITQSCEKRKLKNGQYNSSRGGGRPLEVGFLLLEDWYS